ncbi:GNAT family N-acetyltransferase [Microlunatus soli]|uniref:Predicted acetyltransferase n=1 Tax=Microlunatus soli TaxID=630515 RepID=A0A1H1QAG7_9ACTN|nr:GNAT family N-acetyltransferase [Microlunatus soli]SDS20511.1 Predicted acetyltransferase [Microlunatus soli]
MSFDIRRPATADEAEQSRRLNHEAFGMPAEEPTEPARLTSPGAIDLAAFDGAVLAARLTARDYDSWFGGRLVPTSGIGGVTVALEYRGRGLLTPLFEQLFRTATERGAVISTLYPSASAIYRRMGYEVIGTAETARVPIAALGRIRRPADLVTRRATAADIPAVREVYDVWAAAQNGPLSRRGASFPTTDAELIKEFTGITVAESAGRVVGYSSWKRGQGWGADAVLSVSDLLATTADGYRALLADFGSFGSILGQVSLGTSGLDLLRHLLPTSDWQAGQCDPYMLKIIDVCGALAARGYPTALAVTLDFAVAGDPITGTNGSYRLSIADGRGHCERIDDDAAGLPTFTPNGLAVVYAGAQSTAGVRTVGGLSGPESDDETWNLAFGGRPVRIHDHF